MFFGVWQRRAQVFMANRAEQDETNRMVGADRDNGIDELVHLRFELAERRAPARLTSALHRTALIQRAGHAIAYDHHRRLNCRYLLLKLLEAAARFVKVKPSA